MIFLIQFDVSDRAEMLCKVEEVRREMESRLDSQRRHMVQKESQLKNEVEEMKVGSSGFYFLKPQLKAINRKLTLSGVKGLASLKALFTKLHNP